MAAAVNEYHNFQMYQLTGGQEFHHYPATAPRGVWLSRNQARQVTPRIVNRPTAVGNLVIYKLWVSGYSPTLLELAAADAVADDGACRPTERVLTSKLFVVYCM